ncbi:MAG: secretin N-terminal domain-containing protein, partial [bacterium]|nr:secretin N-terminal domain-containing protein [bacterium]
MKLRKLILWTTVFFLPIFSTGRGAELTQAPVAESSAPEVQQGTQSGTENAPPVPNYPPAVTLEPSSNNPLPQEPRPLNRVEVPSEDQRKQPVEEPVPSSTELRPVSPETVQKTNEQLLEEGVYFNVANEACTDVIKQISRATGKNFLLDEGLSRCKITIISERKVTKDELWEVFLSALEVAGYTVVSGPAGLHKLVPLRAALSEPIPMYTGDSPYTDAFVTRLLPLKNISASDMANAIKGMVSKDGNLFAYPATNTLIITDTGTNIDRLVRLVKELDQTGPQEVLEIIPLQYASAKDVGDKVQQLFDEEGASASGNQRAGRTRAKGGEEDVTKISKILPDERTNSLIVLASKMAIRQIRDVVQRLDTPLTQQSGKIHVYYLRQANAEELATTLSSLTQSMSQERAKLGTEKGAPRAPGLGFELEGQVNITADKNTNALVIMASPKDYETLIDKVISKLDIPRK